MKEQSEDTQLQIDDLDRSILKTLMADALIPFSEIALTLKVSNGTIHQRFEKLKKAGIITGSGIKVNPNKLGCGVTAFVGLSLHHASDYLQVITKLKGFAEIVEADYTTGDFNIFTKVYVTDIEKLYAFLLKLQTLREIQSTGTSMILHSAINRDWLGF